MGSGGVCAAEKIQLVDFTSAADAHVLSLHKSWSARRQYSAIEAGLIQHEQIIMPETKRVPQLATLSFDLFRHFHNLSICNDTRKKKKKLWRVPPPGRNVLTPLPAEHLEIAPRQQCCPWQTQCPPSSGSTSARSPPLGDQKMPGRCPR